MGNRAAATKEVLKIISLYPSDFVQHNLDVYKEYLNGMSDKEFAAFIDRLESGEESIRFVVKNFEDKYLASKEAILEAFRPLYDHLGAEMLVRYWYTDPSSGEKMPSKFPALFLYIPNRMMNQLIAKKRAVAKNNRTVDELTGQAAGKSRVSTFSAPEATVTSGKGHKYISLDFMKIRGGDERAYAMSKQAISNTGEYSIDEIMEHDTTVTSTAIYSTFLTAMHYDNEIWQKGQK